MEKNAVCPFLGMPDDPETSLDFSSAGNHCYHARPVAPVNREHQAKFCLTGDHIHCPVYASGKYVPLHAAMIEPAAALPPAAEAPHPLRKVLGIGVPVVALALLLLAQVPGVSAVLGSWTSAAPLPQDQMGIPVSGLFGQPVPPVTATPLPAPTGAPKEQRPLLSASCAMPQGWTRYTIQPTDTLF